MFKELALRAPVAADCGHNFCKQCVNTEIGSVPCPVCQTEIAVDSLKANKTKHRQVQALIVKCPFVYDGCDWTGPLKLMKVVNGAI
ncbi:unnamed protein product [Strongylus vulgaris]|uniref:RING-type domain-containing protein n=1 Tax=Strongylus vulgaris TaxID=40348 RepID=A0A3P7IZB7_STRVU|nr:unnamed protein product [Strongylus vulgaris]